MTIAATNSERLYMGDGVSQAFFIPFPFDTAADITIIATDLMTGVPSEQSNGFSITGGNGSTGTVTFSTAPLSTTQITILDSPALTQPTDYVSLDAFPAESHERALDRVTRLCKRLHQQLSRCIKFTDGDLVVDGTISSTVNRRGKYLFFNAVTGAVEYATALIGSTLSQSVIAQFLYPQTAAEILAGATPVNFFREESDPRRYGANVALADNSPYFNLASTVSNNGGKPAFVPPGTWKITSAWVLPGASSAYGTGPLSIIAPQNCHGLAFNNQGTIGGARFVRDFSIIGTSTGSSSGIDVGQTYDMSAATGGRISGVQFSNLSIQNFKYGVYARGVWQSTFQDCFLYNNYQGYYFHGQNIVIHIIGGFIQRGTITGTGTTYGVKADTTSGETTQSLHLLNAACYAYDVNVYINNTLYVEISGCDLSINNQVGIEVNACRGGVFIRNNWIQTNNAAFATVGVAIDAVGTAIEDRVIIDGNTIMCTLAFAGSKGVDVGAGNTGVEVINNTIGTAYSTWEFAIGVSNASGAHNMIIANNTIAVTGNCIILGSLSTNVCVHDNTIAAGNPIIWDAGTPAGLSYRARGSFTGTITGVTATVTGTVSWVADGRHVELSIATAGITGTSNTNALTLTGMPVALWPVTDQTAMANLVDNGAGSYGTAVISAGTGVISFRKDATGAVFTTSGTKGVNGTIIRWPYL